MPKVEQLWAFVYDDEAEGEGVVAFLDQVNRTWMPLIGADENRLESLREMAQQIVAGGGGPIKVLKFSLREEVEVLE